MGNLVVRSRVTFQMTTPRVRILLWQREAMEDPVGSAGKAVGVRMEDGAGRVEPALTVPAIKAAQGQEAAVALEERQGLAAMVLTVVMEAMEETGVASP
jgi:hypothetical protein